MGIQRRKQAGLPLGRSVASLAAGSSGGKFEIWRGVRRRRPTLDIGTQLWWAREGGRARNDPRLVGPSLTLLFIVSQRGKGNRGFGGGGERRLAGPFLGPSDKGGEGEREATRTASQQVLNSITRSLAHQKGRKKRKPEGGGRKREGR